MLIPSHRHTSTDLALWQEFEKGDVIHGGTELFLRKVEKAKTTIKKFCKEKTYVSISWGKDSIVIAHLIYQLFGAHGPISFWHARPQRMPETEIVEQQFLSRFPLRYQRLESDKDSAVSDYIAIAGTDRRITGLRGDESGERYLSMCVHGVSTEKSCRPLIHWTAQDVFGYLAIHRLPVHPAYAMVGGGRWERARLRVEILGGPEGQGVGRGQWEREYYGDILRRLETGRGLAVVSDAAVPPLR